MKAVSSVPVGLDALGEVAKRWLSPGTGSVLARFASRGSWPRSRTSRCELFGERYTRTAIRTGNDLCQQDLQLHGWDPVSAEADASSSDHAGLVS